MRDTPDRETYLSTAAETNAVSRHPSAFPDDSPGLYGPGEPPHFPILVVTILSLNGAIFLLQSLSGGSTNTFNFVRFGAQHGASIEEGEYWRFVTAAFLHIGILHLLVNGFCLWQLGRLLERLYGGTHFAFLYLISGVGGTFTSFFLNEFVSPQRVSAGASGAIFGVAAAMLVAGLRYADQIPENLQKAFGTGMLPFIAFNLYYGFALGGIDNYAHVGGALAGVVCGWVLHPHQEGRRDTRLAAGLLMGTVLLCFGLQYRAVNSHERDLRRATDLFRAGRLTEAASLTNDLQKKGSKDARVLTLDAMLKLRRGAVAEALNALREAETLTPRYAQAKIARGSAMMLLKNYPAAVAAYRQAARIDPTDAQPYSGMGGGLVAMNRFEEAGTAYCEALRREPKLATAQYGLALTLELQDKPEEAAEAYRAALKLEPKFLAARHGLARVLIKLGLAEEAAAELRHVLEIDPGDEVARNAVARIEAGKTRR